jgi:two-component system response regulator (stage 0 sporulation protein F)
MSYQALLIDDDAATRVMCRQVLAPFGFELLEAGDGKQALDILRKHTPDLILLDMRLPRVSGAAVLDFLYGSAAHRATRVIVLSAHESFRDFPLKAGDRFLTKPARVQEIREAVRSMIPVTPVS